MTIDRHTAITSLTAIEDTERRTAQAIFYGVASSFLILWGVLTATGYVLTWAYPHRAVTIWPILTTTGLVITAAMTARTRRALTATQGLLGWRLVSAQIALIAFGLTVITTLGPFSGRQLDAFWPLVFMLGYILAGIWIGRFFIVCGLAIALLTVAGFWWIGAWFPLWMAAVDGGALILGGLWLRRQGAAL